MIALLAATFEPIFTLGNLVVALATALAGGFAAFRVTSARAWRDNAEAERAEKERFKALAEERSAAIGRLTERVHELESVIAEVGGAKVMEAVVEQTRVQAERYQAAMSELSVVFSRLHEETAAHEQRANERHQATIRALNAIADRLNGGARG